MSKSKEAWELIRADGRLAAATDDQLTFVILAAAQHALSERGEHWSAAQVCGEGDRGVAQGHGARAGMAGELSSAGGMK